MLVERMLIGLLCDGHLLLEGLPGLAKTTAVKTLAETIATTFQRIQFTPDLLPADIIGTQIYRADTGTFEVKQGRVSQGRQRGIVPGRQKEPPDQLPGQSASSAVA